MQFFNKQLQTKTCNLVRGEPDDLRFWNQSQVCRHCAGLFTTFLPNPRSKTRSNVETLISRKYFHVIVLLHNMTFFSTFSSLAPKTKSSERDRNAKLLPRCCCQFCFSFIWCFFGANYYNVNNAEIDKSFVHMKLPIMWEKRESWSKA